MHAQLITYRLKEVSVEKYTQDMVEPGQRYFAGLATLVSKVWLADEANNRYGGFYVWADKTAMEDFIRSNVGVALMARTYLSDLEFTDWPVNETPSRATRGLATTANAS